MSESQAIAERYIGYCVDDDLCGVTHYINEQQITIFQELDEEEEPDKYIVFKDEVDDDTWDKLITVLTALK